MIDEEKAEAKKKRRLILNSRKRPTDYDGNQRAGGPALDGSAHGFVRKMDDDVKCPICLMKMKTRKLVSHLKDEH